MLKPRYLALLLPLLPALAWQESQDPTQEKTPPFTAFAEQEQARLEAELPGIWTIVAFEQPGRPIDQSRVQGYIFFQDGFASITLQARTIETGILGPERAIWYQGTVHRYRISELRKLQFASVMGFSNLNPAGTVEFTGNSYAREHDVVLQDNELTLTSEVGGRMVLRRVGNTRFPESAIDFLRKNPGGIPVGQR